MINIILRIQCANISPADVNYDETISTLRYANRAKNITNRARINEDPKDALLRQFQVEIEQLRKQLDDNTAEISGSDGESDDSGDNGASYRPKPERLEDILGVEDLLDSSNQEKLDSNIPNLQDNDVIELKRTQ